MNHKNIRNWYAVYTRANCEARLASGLAEKGLECLYPSIEEVHYWSDRKRAIKVPIFPSYIFVHISDHEFYQVKATRGFSHFVSFHGKPEAIPRTQINVIEKLMRSDYQWEVKTNNAVKKGTSVQIIDGPLQGYIGVVVNHVTKNNIAIEVPTLNKSMVFTLKTSQFLPIIH